MKDKEEKLNYYREPRVLAKMENVNAPNSQINIQATLNFQFFGKSIIAFPNPADYSLLLSDSSESNEQTWNLSVPLSSFGIDTSDFKTIAEHKYRFIDKSLLIEKIANDKFPISVVLRPSGFGKTFNLSMLNCFFSNKENSILFHGLKIAEKKKFCQQHQGKYPVIFINFTDLKAENYQQFIEKFKKYLIKIFKEQMEQHEIKGKGELNLLESINCSEETLQLSLGLLIDRLFNRYETPVILLLDAFDVPINYALGQLLRNQQDRQYYQKILGFMKKLFESILKSNDSLKMAILAGTLSLETKNLFSEIDNVYIDNLQSDNWSPYFGFSQAEVFEQFNDAFEMITEIQLDTIENCCGGYGIGKERLFNPRLITTLFDSCKQNGIEYVDEMKQPICNYPQNELIELVINRSNETIKTDFEQLLTNKPIMKSIDKEINLEFVENNADSLWSLLLYSGYLTLQAEVKADSSLSRYLVVPNLERYNFYQQKLKIQSYNLFKNLNKTATKTIVDTELTYFLKYFNTSDFYLEKAQSLYEFIMNGHADAIILEMFIRNCNDNEFWWNIAYQIFQIHKLEVTSIKRIAKIIVNQIPKLNKTNKNTAIRLLNKLQNPDDVVIVMVEKLRMLSVSDANSYIDLLDEIHPNCLIIARTFTACLIDAELDIQKTRFIIKKLQKWLLADNHSALDILLHGLRSSQLLIQFSCINALSEGIYLSGEGSDRIVQAIKRFLNDEELTLRLAAIFSFGRMINSQCAVALSLAEEILKNATEFECFVWMSSLKEDEDQLGSWKGSEAIVVGLKQYFDNGIPEYDNLAITLFGKWAVNGNSEALHLLSQALNDQGMELREKWIKALDQRFFGCSKVVQILASTLNKQENQPLYYNIIKILTQWARHGTKAALEVLNNCLITSTNQQICDECIIALEIGHTEHEVLKNLMEAYSSGPMGSYIQLAAISRLVRHIDIIGKENLLILLAQGLKTESPINLRCRCASLIKYVSTIDPAIEESLWICLQDSDFSLRKATLNTLKEWTNEKNPVAIRLLKKGLVLKKYPEVLEACVSGLLKVNPDDDTARNIGQFIQTNNNDFKDLELSTVKTLTEWAAEHNKTALNILVSGLSANSPKIRAQCVLSLAITKNFDYLPNVLICLQDNKPEVVQAAQITLCAWAANDYSKACQVVKKGLRKPEMMEQWLTALQYVVINNDDFSDLVEPYLKSMVIGIGARIFFQQSVMSPIIINVLIEGLISKHSKVRTSCYQMLITINNGLKAEATRLLMEFLENKPLQKIGPSIKKNVINIITYWAVNYDSNQIVYTALERGMTIPSSPEERKYWLEALSNFPGTNNHEVIRLLGRRMIREDNLEILNIVIQTLEKFLDYRHTSAPDLTILKEGLHSPQPIVRKFCVEAMRKLYQPEGIIPELIPCLKDSNPEVRAAAIWRLGRWSNTNNFTSEEVSEEALQALIKGLKTDQDNLSGQIFLRDKSAKLLEKSLMDDAKCVRSATVQTLLEFVTSNGSSKTALSIIQKNLSSPYEDVQIECAHALKANLGNTTSKVESLQNCLTHAKTQELRRAIIDALLLYVMMGSAAAMAKLKQGLRSQFRSDWLFVMKKNPEPAINFIKALEDHLNSQQAELDPLIIEVLIQWLVSGNQLVEKLLVKVLATQELTKKQEYIVLLKEKTKNSKPKIIAVVRRLEANDDKQISPSPLLSARSVSTTDNEHQKKPNQIKSIKENAMKTTLTLQQIRTMQKEKLDSKTGQPLSKQPFRPTTSNSGGIHTLNEITTETPKQKLAQSTNQEGGAVLRGNNGRRGEIGEQADINVISLQGSARMEDANVGPNADVDVITDKDDAILQEYNIAQRAKVHVIAGIKASELLDRLEQNKIQASAELKDDVENIKKTFDIDQKSKTERASIYNNKQLNAYYQSLRKINYHFGAAKSIQTGTIDQANNMANVAINTGAELAKQIPIVGVGAIILEKILTAKVDIDKHTAMQRLASWTLDSKGEDRLSERFARKMTLLRQNEILTPTPEEQWNKKFADAHGLVEKACAAASIIKTTGKKLVDKASFKVDEIKKGVTFSREDRLALVDMTCVLNAIMDGEIKPITGVSDDEQLEDHLAKMLGLFPQPRTSTYEAKLNSGSTKQSQDSVPKRRLLAGFARMMAPKSKKGTPPPVQPSLTLNKSH